jgi:hypothetical protein
MKRSAVEVANWKEESAMSFTTAVARLHGHPRAVERPASQLPRSQVAVLANEEQLRAAIERAISFERGIALRAAENISRYEQMARNGSLPEAPAREPRDGDASDQKSSASS